MGRSRYKITASPQQAHFVTLTVLYSIQLFTRLAIVEILRDDICYLNTGILKVYAGVVLDTHCHFVLLK